MEDGERNTARTVSAMGWREFEEKLSVETTRGGPADPDRDAMEAYFGAEEFEELQRLATRARSLMPAQKLGNVVFLPGIMGSNLAISEEGNEDLIWVNLFRLALGEFDRLKLRPEDVPRAVRATCLDKRTYARTILRLSEHWNVEPFPYDWRLDIDESSKALAELITLKFKGQPVHLVAHSMGGLVSRNFIRLYKQLWDNMRDNEGKGRGGRLIMLGTPNYGSYSIPQVLTGSEKLVNWLSVLDLSRNLEEVLEIIGTFTGLYQMLPAPSMIPDKTRSIYRQAAWGSFPVIGENLKAAERFHENLEDRETVNAKRMAYIAGCNQQTLCGLVITAPGEFQYTTTCNGDGRVPSELGRIEGLPTYYIEESHGSLPRNDLVLTAVEELMESGVTSILPDRPPAARSILPENSTWHRSPGDQWNSAKLEQIAIRARSGEVTAHEIRAAEETLMRAASCEGQPSARLHEVEVPGGGRTEDKCACIEVEVVCGEITQLSSPVVVVGHYKGVAAAHAESGLDRALCGWISTAGRHSMIGAELGQVFFIPTRCGGVERKGVAADAVLLAGMGDEGRFSRHDLRFLMFNVTYAISKLGISEFGTVLIGSGAGNLKEHVALRSMLFGVCDAISRFPDENRIGKIRLVERDEGRAEVLHSLLKTIREEDSARMLNIQIPEISRLPREESGERDDDAAGGRDFTPRNLGTRITIDREGNLFRFSALTDDAVIPVRTSEVKDYFTVAVTERLVASEYRQEQETFGRLLHTAIFPTEFQQLLQTEYPVTLILDRSTASIPWEMACFDRPGGRAFLGTHLCMARQFRTLLSPAPGIVPQLNEKLRVLVIADPAAEQEYQLSGARAEGRELVRILNLMKCRFNLDIEIVDRIGFSACDMIEILSLLLDEPFDIIHFAGHCFFDQEKPSRGGWVFGKDLTLSAVEIFRTRRAPRLVFSNACFSSVVSQGKAINAEEMNRQLAGIAEAFFERGVRNYIGTGWPVQDNLAVKFCTEFYSRAITGLGAGAWISPETRGKEDVSAGATQQLCPETIGEALRGAREVICSQGSTWGAYQHYGQADARLMHGVGSSAK